MVQIQGVTLNGRPFVCDAQYAYAQDGRLIRLEDRPRDSRFR